MSSSAITRVRGAGMAPWGGARWVPLLRSLARAAGAGSYPSRPGPRGGRFVASAYNLPGHSSLGGARRPLARPHVVAAAVESQGASVLQIALDLHVVGGDRLLARHARSAGSGAVPGHPAVLPGESAMQDALPDRVPQIVRLGHGITPAFDRRRLSRGAAAVLHRPPHPLRTERHVEGPHPEGFQR